MPRIIRCKKLIQGLLAATFYFTALPIYAVCNIIAINNQNFGSVSSQNNVSNHQLAEVIVSCDSAYLLGIDAGLNLNAGLRQLAHIDGQLIPYSLYQNASSTEWGSQNLTTTNTYPQPTLASGGGINITHHIYAQAATQNQTPQGLYNDQVKLILADSSGNPMGVPSTINFNLNLVGFCSLDTSNFSSFGSYPLNSPAIVNMALGNISVTCPSTIAYKIGIGQGKYLAAGKRRMALNDTDFIPYVLKHKGAEWGDFGLNAISADYVETFPSAFSVASIGTGSPQTFTIYGDADINEASSAGTYSDTLIVTLAW